MVFGRRRTEPAKAHTARWAAIGVIVIGAGLVAVLATRSPASTVEARNPLVGQMAPVIAGTTVDGGHFRLPRQPGHFTVINFFASWCEQCKLDGYELVKFNFQHRSEGSPAIVSVVFNDTASSARSYQAQLGTTWPTLADKGNSIALNYGVRGDPTSFIIAPNGRIVASIVSGVTASGLDSLIDRAKASGYGE